MRQVVRIAVDLLFEAARRKWFIGLFGAITLVLLGLASSLQLEVVDGAIAGSKLFGEVLFDDIVSSHRVLGPLYLGTAYAAFYGGALFLVLACSDFAPELLAPGRIEHLLSLPVARWQVLFGTYLGVLTLAAAGTLYGAGGLTLLLGFKSHDFSPALVVGSALGWCGFAVIYAAMLAAAIFVRSAPISGASGVMILVLGVSASHREAIAAMLEAGPKRELFRLALMPIPRLATLADGSAAIASMAPVDAASLARVVAGCFVFAVGLLSVAAWQLDRRDF